MLHRIELFLGLETYTDHLPLVEAMRRYVSEGQTGTIYIEDAVPEIVFSVATAKKELRIRGLEPKLILYISQVLQLWPQGDPGAPAMPGSPKVLIPAGFPGALEPRSYVCKIKI